MEPKEMSEKTKQFGFILAMVTAATIMFLFAVVWAYKLLSGSATVPDSFSTGFWVMLLAALNTALLVFQGRVNREHISHELRNGGGQAVAEKTAVLTKEILQEPPAIPTVPAPEQSIVIRGARGRFVRKDPPPL